MATSEEGAILLGGAFAGAIIPGLADEAIVRLIGPLRDSWYGHMRDDAQPSAPRTFVAMDEGPYCLQDRLNAWLQDEDGESGGEACRIIQLVPPSLWFILTRVTPDPVTYEAAWGQTHWETAELLRTRVGCSPAEVAVLDLLRFFHQILAVLDAPSRDAALWAEEQAASMFGGDAVREFCAQHYGPVPRNGSTDMWASEYTPSFWRMGTTSMILKFTADDGMSTALKCLLPVYSTDVRIATATSNYSIDYRAVPDVIPEIYTSSPRWIHMRFITGATLEEWINAQRHLFNASILSAPSPYLLREIGVRLTQQIRVIHHSGRAHLDLSPQNVLVTNEGLRHLDTRLIDLGINYASFGAVQGARSPASPFVAPELRQGVQLDSEGRVKADAYSLGLLCASLLHGAPIHNGRLHDDFFAYYPALAWVLLDLTDEDRGRRLSLFPTGATDPGLVFAGISEALSSLLRDVRPPARPRNRDSIKSVAIALAQPFKRPFSLHQRRRDVQRLETSTSMPGLNDVGVALDATYLRRWSWIASMWCTVIVLWLTLYIYAPFNATPLPGVFNLYVSDSPGRAPSLWAALAPFWDGDKDVTNKAYLGPRLIALNLVVVSLHYYQNVLSDISARRLFGGRIGNLRVVTYELALRGVPILIPFMVLIAQAVDAGLWLYMCLAAATAMTAANFGIYHLVASLDKQYNGGQEGAIAEYSGWRWSMLVYVVIIAIIAVVVHQDYDDLYLYAVAGLLFVNVVLHYVVKCTFSAPRLRAAFVRVTLMARRAGAEFETPSDMQAVGHHSSFSDSIVVTPSTP